MLSKPERVSVSIVLQDQHGQSGTLNRVGSQPGTSVTEGRPRCSKKKRMERFVYSVWRVQLTAWTVIRIVMSGVPSPLRSRGTGVVPMGKRGSQGVMLGGATPLIA